MSKLSNIAKWLAWNKLLCTINKWRWQKSHKKREFSQIDFCNRQFDTYKKYYAYHTLPRIANNRIHMTMKESWPVCSSSSSPHDYPVSCELSHHLYLIRHFSSSDHWAWVFVLLTLEAQLISRLYAARILMQSKIKAKWWRK